MKKFVELAQHILMIADDAYLSGSTEWVELVKEAKNAFKSEARSNKIMLLKDNQENYDWGLLTTKEWQDRINEINSK